ncbi:MAG: nucleotide exchange factor GrpE, partial [Bacteroidales bacterium]|nr:nucleotide exchange factor GrpE [Bacteroidales bacterium]
ANNKYLTLYADFENFRKHSNKQRLDLIENAGEDLIKSLLPILDDFDRALQNMAKSEDEMVKQMLEGMNLIYKKFYGILEKKGLKPIDAKGKAFDENLHEAVTMFPAPTEEDKGKVIDEVEKGYFLNNKVLRFSKVVVAQ